MDEIQTLRLKQGAAGDARSYSRTAAPLGDNPEVPQRDLYDARIAWWFGKRIYLGHDSRIARLFWLLSEHVGRAYRLSHVQQVVDGLLTDTCLGMSEHDMDKADKRLRKDVSRLREQMREAGLDDHIIIHREKDDRIGRSLSMIRRHQ